MGQFGRLTSLDDLPDREDADRAHPQGDEADRGRREAGPQQKVKPPFTVPQDLQAAIDAAPAAKATWEAFPPSCQREYVEWVTEAKRDETRGKRLNQTLEWLAEGKRRNWKYENC